jgi:hypothetical protein
MPHYFFSARLSRFYMSGHEIDKLTQIYFDFFIYLFVIVVFLYIIKLTELDKSVKLIT